MRKSSFSIFLLATAFFCYGQKDGNNEQTTALAVNDTHSSIEQLAEQPAVDDTLYCIKLMNQAITARYGSDGPNFLQDVLHEKMGCTVCSEYNDKDMHDVMLWVLSKVEKGDLMRFWQFYWSSLSHEEDGGAVNHDHDREVERILSLMDKHSPEMKRAAYIAYEYFSNGVMSDDWYPYPEDYIKAVKPYAERYKHKFWMPKFEDRVCVIERVESIYNEVLSCFNQKIYRDVDYDRFFSKNLKTLWRELPTDYAVINANPWTWTQEPDSFVLGSVELKRFVQDTAVVSVTTNCFGHSSTRRDDFYDCGISQRTLWLVHEDGNWFVDEFRDKNETPSFSISHMIRDFKREQEARQQVESIYNEVFACQNKGEGFDGDAYISTNLKALWESLPEGELIYSADVWTGVQDFDSLILEGVGADGLRNSLRRDEQRKDAFVISVHFQTSDKGRTNTAYVKTVYERGGWYIDDIVHSFNGEEYSIAKIAEMFRHHP